MTDAKKPDTGKAHHIKGPGDRYEALLDVLEHQKTQAEADRARDVRDRIRRKKESRTPYWILGVLTVLTVWLWVFPPEFLRIEPPEPPPIQEEEASLRFAMYVQAQRIKAFQLEHGRLPEDLEEAGPPLPGMDYIPLTSTLYQLTGATDRVTLTYRSDLPLQEFVGEGARTIDETAL